MKVVGNLNVKDNVVIGLGATSPVYATARLQVKGVDFSNGTKLLDFRNGSNTQMVQLSNDANFSIGKANYLTNTRLYLHATNTSLTYNINAIMTTTAANGYGISSTVRAATNAYNYFSAIGTLGYSRGVFAVAESASVNNQGVYGSARNGNTTSVAVFGNIPAVSSASSQYTASFSGINNDNMSTTKYGSFLTIGSSATSGVTSYGYRTAISPGTNSTSGTQFGVHIGLGDAGGTNILNTGVYVDCNSAGVGSVNCAIHTVGGDVKFDYLSGAGERVVVAESDGTLKISTAGTITYAADLVFTANTALTITHNINTDVLVQVIDSSGKIITPNVVDNFTSTTVDIELTVSGTYRVIIK